MFVKDNICINSKTLRINPAFSYGVLHDLYEQKIFMVKNVVRR